MNRTKLLEKMHITAEDLSEIRSAVADAEEKTSGEIALAVTAESADYSFHELRAAVLLGAALFAALIPVHTTVTKIVENFFWAVPSWTTTAIYGFTAFLTIGVLFLFANIPLLDRAIIPRRIRSRMVYNRALRHFVESGVYATRDRTGILVFLSWMEREVRIIADKGISEKIDQATWNTLAETIALGVRDGKTAAALLEAVRECGRILADHFPADSINENELADGLVVLEKGE